MHALVSVVLVNQYVWLYDIITETGMRPSIWMYCIRPMWMDVHVYVLNLYCINTSNNN